MSKKRQDKKLLPDPEEIEPEDEAAETGANSSPSSIIQRGWIAFLCLAYLLGIGTGFLVWNQRGAAQATLTDAGQTAALQTSTPGPDLSLLSAQVNPPEGYTIPVSVGDLGPQLISAGVIDLPKFLAVFNNGSSPLSNDLLAVLNKGSDAPVLINTSNSHFWLDFFWAVGLANQNPILTEGEMASQGIEKAGSFASTGGWEIASRPVMEIYSSLPMIQLSTEQQALLDEVSKMVYRPCCNNSTHFPDCNHGMAMLGLLELMASQGASKDQMLEAAKYVNAYWFPQQMLQVAIAYKAGKNVEFKDLDPALAVGPEAFSSAGYQAMSQWLAQNRLLPSNPGGGGGNGCGL